MSNRLPILFHKIGTSCRALRASPFKFNKDALAWYKWYWADQLV